MKTLFEDNVSNTDSQDYLVEECLSTQPDYRVNEHDDLIRLIFLGVLTASSAISFIVLLVYALIQVLV